MWVERGTGDRKEETNGRRGESKKKLTYSLFLDSLRSKGRESAWVGEWEKDEKDERGKVGKARTNKRRYPM